MNKFLIYLIPFFACNIIPCRANSNDAEIDSCNPSFKEIYDFQIGDVFQYVNESWTSAGGAGMIVKRTSKYSIANKWIFGDTLVYSISGIKRFEYSCEIGPFPGCETHSESNTFQDTLYYIDSINHSLNKCKDELVSNFMGEDFGEVYTKVRIKFPGLCAKSASCTTIFIESKRHAGGGKIRK
jgi:hypothetical protein